MAEEVTTNSYAIVAVAVMMLEMDALITIVMEAAARYSAG